MSNPQKDGKFSRKFSEKKEEVIRPSKTFTFYGVTLRKDEISIGLKIQMENGDSDNYFYHEITRLKCKKGNTVLTFYSSDEIITIEGKDLNVLEEYMLEHKAVWIKAPSSSVTIPENVKGTVIIESIEIKEKD